MMFLLMRHGEAEYSISSDFDRRLTDSGRAEVRQVSERLADRNIEIERVVVSPYTRARETAEIVRQSLSLPEAAISEGITPDRSPAEAVAALDGLRQNCECFLAVMHQPIISRLILYLTGVDQPMATSNVAVLETEVVERGCCELICVL